MEDFPVIDDYINFNEDFKPLKAQIFRNHIFADSGWVNEGEGRITYIKDGYWKYLVDSFLLSENFVFRPISKEERVKVFEEVPILLTTILFNTPAPLFTVLEIGRAHV